MRRLLPSALLHLLLLLLPWSSSGLTSPRGRVTLGVDYGLKRVGVGVGAGWASRPVCVIKNEGNETAVAVELVRLARGQRAKAFVVGLPLERNGSESHQSALTRHFARTLARVATANVSLWDERFSTREAETMLGSMPAEYLDALAACAILDDFFANEGRGAEVLETTALLARRDRDRREKEEKGIDGEIFSVRAKARLEQKRRLFKYLE